jgi:serine/threonine-protein kinase PpkA
MRITKVYCLVLSFLIGISITGVNAKTKVKPSKAKKEKTSVTKLLNLKNPQKTVDIPVEPVMVTESNRVLNRAQPQPQIGKALVPIVVNIPAGCFQMGSPINEAGRSEDESMHRVCVKSFKLSKNEVTVAEFKKFVDATQFSTDAERNSLEIGCWSHQKAAENHWDWRDWANWKQPVKGVANIDATPVTCVSYHDVMVYIDWLNQETGQVYRLPTEAEWEYAARAGTTTARYWGNNPDIACGFANVADSTKSGTEQWEQNHHCEDGYFYIATVRALKANKFDLHDMLGNVWEWTCSVYDEKYTGKEALCMDKYPGFEAMISIRGGGWNADPDRIRAAARNWSTAWSRQANLGFRLVRDY